MNTSAAAAAAAAGVVVSLYRCLPLSVCLCMSIVRITTFLENLEMSGNFAVVRDMSGKKFIR